MATVIVGSFGADPSLTQPEKYSSCFWDFTNGWVCQTVDTPPATPNAPNAPIAGNPAPTSLAPLAIMASKGRDCGCCGSGGNGGASPAATGVGSALSLSIAKQCGCGYTNREALFAIGVAFLFFLILSDR